MCERGVATRSGREGIQITPGGSEAAQLLSLKTAALEPCTALQAPLEPALEPCTALQASLEPALEP